MTSPKTTSDPFAGPRYWCQQHLSVTVNGPHGQTSTAVGKPFARIGSHARAEIVLPDEELAPCGLYLHATDDGIYFVRLDQEAATDGPVLGRLQPDQEMTLGLYRISAKCSAAPALEAGSPSGAQVRPSSALPQPLLIFSRRGRKISHYRLRHRLTVVGRRQSCTLRLRYNSVSRAHCIFYRSANGLWIVDLLSTHGTILDGCGVEAAEWPIRSDLMLGDIVITHASPNADKMAEDELATRIEGLKEQDARIAADREAIARERVLLEQQREELSRQRKTWQAECAAKEDEWANRAAAIKEQDARIAAEREAFARERVLLEQQFARERVLLEQQQQEEFSRQREAWKAECAAKEDELANRFEGLKEQDARIAADREAFAPELASVELWQCREAQAGDLFPTRETEELSTGLGSDAVVASEGEIGSAQVAVQKEKDWEEERRYHEFYERLIDRLVQIEPGEQTRWRWWISAITVGLLILVVILAAAGVFRVPS